MLSYAAKIDQGGGSLENQPLEEPITSCTRPYDDTLPKGWALKSSTVQRKRLNNIQKNYLTKMFDLGEKTCDLAACSKLSKFSISMLQEICVFYEQDASSIKGTRKQPYVVLLLKLIENCRCKSE